MGISGQYIDRENATISLHAVERFRERVGSASLGIVQGAFRRSRLLCKKNWWGPKVTSYWLDEATGAVFIASQIDGELIVRTVLGESESISSPEAAKALRAWKKSRRVARCST